MRQTRVGIHLGSDARFFAEDALVDYPFVAKGVHAADLEVGWWEAGVAGRKEYR